jgi:HEAT repeat protein
MEPWKGSAGGWIALRLDAHRRIDLRGPGHGPGRAAAGEPERPVGATEAGLRVVAELLPDETLGPLLSDRKNPEERAARRPYEAALASLLKVPGAAELALELVADPDLKTRHLCLDVLLTVRPKGGEKQVARIAVDAPETNSILANKAMAVLMRYATPEAADELLALADPRRTVGLGTYAIACAGGTRQPHVGPAVVKHLEDRLATTEVLRACAMSGNREVVPRLKAFFEKVSKENVPENRLDLKRQQQKETLAALWVLQDRDTFEFIAGACEKHQLSISRPEDALLIGGWYKPEVLPAYILEAVDPHRPSARSRLAESYLSTVYANIHADGAQDRWKERVKRLGERLVPLLVDALEDPNVSVQESAYGALRHRESVLAGDEARMVYEALAVYGERFRKTPAPAEPDESDKRRIKMFIMELGDRDEPTWRLAAHRLMQIGTPTVPALVEFLAAKDEPVYERAAQILINIRPAPVSALIEALGDRRPEARARAAWTLGSVCRLEDRKSLPPIVKALEKSLGDEEAKVRQAAAQALSSHGRAAAAAEPALRKALADSDGTVRIQAASALRSICADIKEAVAVLARLLEDEAPGVRAGAARALGGIGPDGREAVPALARLLRDGDTFVRRSAASALGAIGPDARETIPALAGLLGDRDMSWDSSAALGRIGPAAIPALTAALGSKDSEVRANAVGALGAMGRPAKERIPAIAELLAKDPEHRVRRAAAAALGRVALGERTAVFALLKVLDEKEEGIEEKVASVRGSALEALGYMGASAVPALVEALAEPDVRMRMHAAAMLAGSGAASQAVPALEKALGDADPAVRSYAARALGAAGAAATRRVPALTKLLEDKDESVRYGAKQAIELIRRDGSLARP